ncbi:MAG TPA: dTMP kinase [Geobacteraceae bacterium]
MACFITFEGIEGCGKTTQLQRLANRLEAGGLPVLRTREPGGCPIADQIRSILLNADNSAMQPMTELLLYAGARAQHVAEVVRPALAAGKTVLCDRFTDATVAYQGFARGLNGDIIEQLNRMATGNLSPDLTLLLDCPVEVGLGRATARINATRGEKEERFERESLQFHEKVRSGYLELARREPQRFIVIDGSQGPDATEHLVANAVLARLTAG